MVKEKDEVLIKSGLEIHQQIDTGKLFCNCPSLLRQDEPDYTVERKLHKVAGESGEVDVAVGYEASKDKKFVYQAYDDNCCLLELDESPPFPINQEALKIAIQISLLLNCEIIQDTQIMRKNVIDGSNTSGFQRTVLIARNGYVETKQGRVGIEIVALEEDAARIISKDKEKSVFRLDRLGIPLVEIATAPDINKPNQAKEVALHIGDVLRACKVMRGIGTIRQDVNLSVRLDNKQGKRIEIKGVQEPELIEKTILSEVERQKKLIKQDKSEEEVRKANEDGTTSFLRPLPGAGRMYPETDLELLHISREMINEVKAKLPRLRQEIREELRGKGLSEELMKLILSSRKLEEFNELNSVFNKPDLIVKLLVLWPAEFSKKQKAKNKITIDVAESILQALEAGKINENDCKQVEFEYLGGKPIEQALKVERVENIEDEIIKLVKEKPGLSINAYMGLAMQKFKGKVSGKQIAEILARIVK